MSQPKLPLLSLLSHVYQVRRKRWAVSAGQVSLWAVLCFCLPLAASAQEPNNQIANNNAQVLLEKRYQNALYAYFQGDVQDALSQLAWIEERYPQGLLQLPAYLRAQDIEPTLLKGVLSLAYGLEDQAASLFERYLGAYESAEKRTQAWYLLGLTYYRQGQWQQASEAFSQIVEAEANDYLDVQSHDQWVYLQAQLRNQYLTDATPTLPENWPHALSDNSIYHYYLLYNQALASLKNGETERAIEQLASLVNRPNRGFTQLITGWFSPLLQESRPDSEDEAQEQQQEVLGIIDRANLTLAYVLLQQNKPQQAYRVFAKIRRQGLDGDAAVLGYGWAAVKSEELQTALGIWQSLINLPQHSEYTLEAYLASSYAYEKAYAPRQSVAVLSAGVSRFHQALAELSVAREQVNQAPFLLSLAHNYDAEQALLIAPKIANSPDTSMLLELLNSIGVSNGFRHELSALQQTQRLDAQYQEWQTRMAHYQLMLDEREIERTERAKAMLQSQIFEQLAQLQAKRDALAKQLRVAEQQADGIVLMPLEYQQQYTRLQGAKQRWADIEQAQSRLQQNTLKAEYAQRLRRAEGILIWQASEAYADKRWQAQKALVELDSELSRVTEQQNQLLTALQGRPNYAEQRKRVGNLTIRITQQQQNNDALQGQLLGRLSQQLSALIDQQVLNVNDYIMQAQLAMVRLKDQALQQNQAHGSQIPKPEIGRPMQLSPKAAEVQPK
ncbi:tetratricopeptide repeat protein [Paraglaciecola sp.]|uniref:tetratricopeptide repeat protein n=1 Tax=Paraglaciecola sp. TaxID=1920173 RepID=UPI00273D35BE|nr:tetratricopeptide repeat protein [Paraglaciecola sp.]MDP5030584.1 tetratricopeptide repeat protein [Paraglaciecola sp.]